MALSVVITGGSSGIGASLAKVFSKEGHRVLIIARRESELLKVKGEDANIEIFVGDVTKRGDVETALSVAIEKFGRVDVWVNNAGRGITKSVIDLTDEDVDEMVAINLKSGLYGMQIAAKYFMSEEAGKKGHIINISSVLGRVPFASIRSSYSAAKHALNSLTANLRVDLKANYPNIIVSTVSPGPVATDFGLNAGGGDSRANPNSQDVEEVARIIYDVTNTKEIDVYTRPIYAENVVNYYKDISTGEKHFIANPVP
jgi:NAD(P)-dependent dehydrogenase (short-subunit alcohol dehydrogenase family)